MPFCCVQQRLSVTAGVTNPLVGEGNHEGSSKITTRESINDGHNGRVVATCTGTTTNE
ncbi:hypothetical protein SEA_AUSPICE_137 [Mycobacterium phage Auspice]|nr:hypothetical protein SEA_AUSPICE_137 [Mycobacterium phage Auspice]